MRHIQVHVYIYFGKCIYIELSFLLHSTDSVNILDV